MLAVLLAAALLTSPAAAVAEILVLRGRRAEAEAELRRAAEDGKRSGAHRGEVMALVALSKLRLDAGDATGAAEAALRGLAAARAFGDPELVSEAERAARP